VRPGSRVRALTAALALTTGVVAGDPAGSAGRVPVEPALALAPPCGPAGTTVAVTGTGFPVGAGSVSFALGLFLDGELVVPVAVDPQDGSLATSLVIPAGTGAGPHVVSVRLLASAGAVGAAPLGFAPRPRLPAALSASQAADLASATFSVGCPGATIELDPTCAEPGAPVSVAGDGFAPGAVVVTFAGRPVATLTTQTGRFTATFVVPADTAPGDHPVAAGSADPVALAIPCRGAATLVVEPALGPPGIVVEARARGFPPGSVVSVAWDPGLGTASGLADDGGEVRIRVLVFHRDVLGPRELLASSGGLGARTGFLVVPPSQQAPDFVVRR